MVTVPQKGESSGVREVDLGCRGGSRHTHTRTKTHEEKTHYLGGVAKVSAREGTWAKKKSLKIN